MGSVSIKNILWAFLFPALVFFVHLFFMVVLRVYTFIPWFDLPAHFIGGFSVGVTGILLLKELKRLGWYNANDFVSFIFVVCFVGTVAVVWEFYEFAVDQILGWNWQVSITDIMLDLFLGLFGSTVVGISLFIWRQSNKK